MATARRRPDVAGPPEPYGAGTVRELTERLQSLRAWAGASYRDIHREVARSRHARGVVEQPALNTVYRCLRPDRSRLDVELVVDIARVLLDDPAAAEAWRHACQVIAGRASAAGIVDVFDVLPPDLATFVGRRRELRSITQWVDRGVTGVLISAITGMAGVGKTGLAVHAAHLLADRASFDQILMVNLRGFDPARPPADPAAVLAGFLRRLGVPGPQILRLDLAGRAASYRRLLAGRRALILLDNAAAAEQVRPLLPDTPGCLALVTTRRATIDLPGVRHLPLGVFTPAESARLLRDTAGRPRSRSDPHTVGRIAELLGHLPLALTLAAARIRANPDWSLADHLERLQSHREQLRLDTGVEMALSLSYADQPVELRQTLRRLAMHPGADIEPYATAALAGVDLPTARAHLRSLRDEGLLLTATAGRFALHDLVRRYAASQAQDEDPASAGQAAVSRLLDHYAYAASAAIDHYAPQAKDQRPYPPAPGTPTPDLVDVESAIAWLDTERTNLIAAACHAADHGRSDHASLQSDILWRYLDTTGHYHDAKLLHTAALRTTDRGGRCRALSQLGNACYRLGHCQQSIGYFRQALDVARAIDDRATQARALSGLGSVYWRLGHYQQSLDYQHRALTTCRAIGDRTGEGRAHNGLAGVYYQLGRYQQALNHIHRDLTIAGETGDRVRERIDLNNLGVVYDRLGRYEQAEAHYRRALALATELAERVGQSNALVGLGSVSERTGRYADALDFYRRGLAIAGEIHDRSGEAYALDGAGVAHRHLGRTSTALEHHRQALAIARQIEDQQVEITVLNNMGETLCQLGAPEQATEQHRRALGLAEAHGEAYERARALSGIARAQHDLGHGATARTHLQQALTLYDDLGVPETNGARVLLAAWAPPVGRAGGRRRQQVLLRGR
jgi:tetratricopeptide (TPR) repeat protein